MRCSEGYEPSFGLTQRLPRPASVLEPSDEVSAGDPLPPLPDHEDRKLSCVAGLPKALDADAQASSRLREGEQFGVDRVASHWKPRVHQLRPYWSWHELPYFVKCPYALRNRVQARRIVLASSPCRCASSSNA